MLTSSTNSFSSSSSIVKLIESSLSNPLLSGIIRLHSIWDEEQTLEIINKYVLNN